MLRLSGSTARWSDGRIEGDRAVAFPLVVTAQTGLGPVAFRAHQRYDDGEVVRWSARLSVLPASTEDEPSQQLGRAFVAGAVGLAILLGSLLVVRRLRR